MALPLKIKIRWGYVFAFLMLGVSYFLIFHILGKLSDEANGVTYSYRIINNLERLRSEVANAESSVRGFILTKEDRFLEPYHSGVASAVTITKDLHVLTGPRSYKPEVDALAGLVDRRMKMLGGSVDRFREAGNTVTDAIRSNREMNKRMSDSIRAVVRDIQAKEFTEMRSRDKRLERSFNTTRVIAITTLLVALVTVFYSLFVYNRENRAKENADGQAENYRRELEDRVSELARVNVELQELKSIEKFASTGRIARTMAHEVRNPLTNISLASEQIRDLVEKNPEAELLLDMVTRNATRINQLVSDLLNSTRFVQLAYTPSDVNQLLEEALEQAKDRIELNSVLIERKLEPGIRPIMVDPEKIKLAFLNIIVNGIEAMEKGKAVLQVSTRSVDTKVVIEFRDNGVGLDEEAQQKLFEPYFTSKLKGNGLGLTNTQNIILNHKGNIKVRSSVGSGAVFQITLNREALEQMASEAANGKP